MAFNIYTDDGVLHQNVPSVEMPANAEKTIYNKFIAENDVPATPEGELEVTQNGTYDVTDKASVRVQVEGGEVETEEGAGTPTESEQTILPATGKLFSKFTIHRIPQQYIVPTGKKEIVANGDNIDVSQYATVKVTVQAADAPTLTATYNGSAVVIGTDIETLRSDIYVTISFETGDEIALGDDEYNLTGSIAVEGGNPLTVTFGGMMAQFTVTGYAIHTHTATFKADGVTVGTVTFEEGQASIDEPAVPTKNHYTGAWESYTLGTTDITINAVYTAITYTITFKDDGGNHPQSYTEPTAGSVTAPTPTPRSGYTVEWPSWAVEYNNSQVVEAVYTEIVAAGVSMKVIRPGTTRSGKITIEPNSSVTQYSSHLPSGTKSLAFDVSNFTGVAGNGCPTHCKITALSTPSANTLKNSEFDITNDGETITATNVTGTGMYSVEYVPVGTTNYPYGGLGLYPRAQFDCDIEYTIVLSW